MQKGISLFFLLIPLLAQSQSVKVTGSDEDFSRFTTFRVDKGEIVTISDQKMNDQKIYQIIKEAVTHHLTDKGYKHVEDSSAELVINYVGQMLKRVDSEQLGPLGQQPASNPSDVSNTRNWSREYSQGNLVIEVTEVGNKKTVWRAEAALENVSLDDERILNSITYRAFKKFPSRKKK